MAMILHRLPGTRLFINVAPADGPLWATNATFCFYHHPESAAGSITLDATQVVRGTYAFLPPNPAAPFGMLASALAGVAPQHGHLLLWMEPTWDTPRRELAYADGVVRSSLGLTLWGFAALKDDTPGRGDLAIDIPIGAKAAFGPDHLVVTDPGVELVITVDGEPIRRRPLGDQIQLCMEAGPRCATITGGLSPADTADWIAALTPQVRYMWKATALPTIKSARILSHNAGDHRAVAARFQLQSYTADRRFTRIALLPAGSDPVMVSCLTDTSGHAVELSPADEAGIYFEQFGGTGNYASLFGKFAVNGLQSTFSVNAAPREIMPGSAGTEFFQLHKDDYDGLYFEPGQPAFIKFAAESEPTTVTGGFTTARIAPCRTGPTAAWATTPYSFVAQSEEEPLYGRRQVDGVVLSSAPSSNSNVFFDPAPAPVPANVSLPFFPFRGIPKGTIKQTERLDIEALSPERSRLVAEAKKLVFQALATTLETQRTWITTPQGLLVEIDAANEWHKIKLGEGDRWKMLIERPTVNGEPVARWALQEALSRSEVFVVVSRQKLGDIPATGDPALGAIKLEIEIAGWPMKVNLVSTSTMGGDQNKEPPALDSGRAPLLILKLSKGPLDAMLGNVGRWALARVFNESPQATCNGAIKALDNLRTLSEGRSPLVGSDAPPEYQRLAPELKPHYEALYSKVTDDDWTGILVLNAHVPFDDVPPQLAVVTEGAQTGDAEGEGDDEKISEFGVPVLGLDLSRVVPDAGGLLQLEKTSAFGAIHYHSPRPLPADKADFDFKLRTLNAVFDNSELRTFLASMQLRLSEFFGADTEADNNRLLDILCRYEGKSAAGKEDEYIFRALGMRTMGFTGNEFLDKLTVNRIDLTSRRIAPRTVESRFGMWGALEFGPKFSKVTGIRKIEYENAALVMREKTYKIDVGNVRVDFKKGDGADGLLAKFPFQLSGMRWAPLDIPQELAGIGFTGLNLPGLQGLDASSFDFALELDLNLGSMGKLFEAAEFLKARILVGWHKVGGSSKKFCVGFRFQGGNGPLDIGVNGVMRLTAKEVNLQTYSDPAGIGLGLLHPQLEVMGYKVPTKTTDTLVAFLPAGESDIAWAWARLDTEVGPLKLHYFALGQRMHLVPAGIFDRDASLSDIVEKSLKWVSPKQDNGVAKLPDIGKLYAKEAGWGVVADGEVAPFKFRFVFLDGLNRYGLGVNLPNIANIDVLYRKLSDGVGVFSAEIEPQFRTLEMGAATVTLPIVGFDALTNGNWSINIGYHGNDFSRGATVQLLPFLGSGGLRFGKLDWRSSYVLNSPHSQNGPLIQRLKLDPVIEMSFAARVGIGKEYREGVFAAGITLSVYGIFEGALGRPTDPAFPNGAPCRYIKLAGTAGLLLEIFGAVNFAVVSAAVSIRMWVEVGLTLESWTPVVVHAEAGVSVYVRFVIARFKIFGRRIEIAIHFSFATRVRFTQQLPYAFDGNNPYESAARVARIAQEAGLLAYKATQPLLWVPHKLAPSPTRVPAAATIEPMLSGDSPVILPMLFAMESAGEDGLSLFTVQLFTWALRLSLGLAPEALNPVTVELPEFSALCSRVSPPKGNSLARWGDKPLDFNVLEAFLRDHLLLELEEVPQVPAAHQAAGEAAGLADPEPPQGILLPWFADIVIRALATGVEPRTLRDFRKTDSRPVNETWERGLFDRLSESVPDYRQDDAEIVKSMLAVTPLVTMQKGDKEALDAITEDWVASLLQGIAQRALQAARKIAKPQPHGKAPIVEMAELVDALLTPEMGGSLAAQVGKHASTFLHHGLRVPEHEGDTATLALSEFLRTEIPLAELAAAQQWTLSFSPRDDFQGGWIAGVSKVDNLKAKDADDRLQDLERRLAARKVRLFAHLEESDLSQTTQPRRFIVDTLVPLGKGGTGKKSLRTAAVPPALSALAQRRGASLAVVARLEDPRKPNQSTGCPSRWFVKIDVQLEEKPGDAQKARSGYSVFHVDMRIRGLLMNMIAGGGSLVKNARLVYAAEGKVPAVPLEFLEQDEAFFFVSNLSKEPNPPHQALMTAAPADTPTYAVLGDTEALAQILWMAATVNAPGFHLAFKGNKDPIAHLFKEAAIASVSLLFELEAAAEFTPLIDGLLLDEALVVDEQVVSLTTPDVRESLTTTPDGQVAVIIERENPLHDFKIGSDDDEEDLRCLAARYELVDYWAEAEKMRLDRGSVMPARVTMDEKEQIAAEGAAEPPILRHRILVPVSKITGLANPYDVVGIDVAPLLKIGLRDGAGHYLADDACEVVWTDPARTRLLYRDTILRLQELAGVEAKWQLKPQGTDAAVQVELHWSAKNLFSDKPRLAEQQRAATLAQFKRVSNATNARDFRASLEVSFDGRVIVSPDIKATVQDWLARICVQLADGTDQDCKQTLVATVRTESWPASTPQPVRIDVAVGFYRDPDLCDSRLLDRDQNGVVSEEEKKASDIASVRSPVLPDDLQTPKDWKCWAIQVQTAFNQTFSLLRRLEADVETQAGRPLGAAVWLLRRCMLTTAQTTASASSFYAPAPLAKTFQSGSVSVPMPIGPRTTVDAKDVDLNALAARAAGALETMVSRAVGEALCQWRPDLYARLARSKRRMADAMAGRLESIVANGGDVPDKAKDKFRNACRADTRTSFAPAALVNVRLTAVSAGRTFLWGPVEIARSQAVSERDSPLSFSPVRIHLDASGLGGSFDFVVQWADPGSLPLAVVSGAMKVRPQYVEVTGTQEIDGYIPSDWYEVVWSGELSPEVEIRVQPTAGNTWNIPLPLRLIPPTPMILRHGATPENPQHAGDLAGFMEVARRWQYGLSAMVPSMDHDTAEVTVRFGDALGLKSLSGDPLFDALVAFSYHAYRIDQVATDLTATGKADANELELAVDVFERIAEALSAPPITLASALADSDARVVQLHTKRHPTSKTGLPAEIRWTVSPESVKDTVSAMLLQTISLTEGDFPLTPDSGDPAQGVARYEERPDAVAALAGMAGLSPRHVRLSKLDVMVQGRAMPSVKARRNADLLGADTPIAQSFIFETPTVRSPDALVPRLAHKERFDLSKGGAALPIMHWLCKLRDTLVQGVDASRFALDVTARFKLELVNDQGTAIDYYTPLPALKSASASERDWVRTLANRYLTAILRLEPQARRGGELELNIQVFPVGTGESHKPVLSLPRLFLPLNKVTDLEVQSCPWVVATAADELPVHQLAAYVFERTRNLAADNPETVRFREALVARASIDFEEATQAPMPSPADLASAEGRAAWVGALCVASATRNQKN